MGDIYIGRNEDGELTHSVKGRVKPNHIYITRRYVNGRWVYTYPKKKNGNRMKNRIKDNNAEYQNELNSVSSLYPANRETNSRKSRRRRRRSMQLQHSAKGSTWQKKGASYISRVKKNGKWVYTYASNKAGQAGRAVSTGAANVVNTVSTAAGNARRSVRSAVASSRVNPDVMSTRLRKKTRKNVAKGKAEVNEILSRLRKSSSAAAKIAKRKYTAAQKAASLAATQAKDSARKTKRKIKNAVSVKETAYITDVSTGKRRPAPTDLFDNTSNKKKYKKQAKAQRHTKRVIAREQAVGKVKRTVKKYTPDIKNLRSGVIDTRYRGRTVSKKVDKKNAGKKR